MLKTYVISLEYPTQLMETLPSKGLLPIWSPGVNGKALTEAEIRKNTTPLCAAICPLPCIGSGMAHMNAWASILKNNDDYALIVEDDVTFVPDFYEKLQLSLKHVPSDYDILFLGCFGCTSDTSLFSLGGRAAGYVGLTDQTVDINPYIVKPTSIVGVHAYIVSRKGARILLDNLAGKISTYVDYCMQNLIKNKQLAVYLTNPRIAFQTSTDLTGSSATSKVHPLLLQKVVEGLYLDDAYSAKYLLTVTAAKVGPFPITFNSFLFLVAGLFVALMQPPLLLLSAVFVVFSLPDLVVGSDPYSVLLHYVLLVTPTAILTYRR